MSAAESLSLLIVDDEPDMRSSMARILKLRGYRVSTASSGDEAIDSVRRSEPDGVLMDIVMPGMDGVEAFRRIRAFAPNVFLIFMTAFTKAMEDARDEAPVEVLSKPVEFEQLCTLIENAAVTRPILIVDDDPDFCRSLCRVLTAKGLDAHLAHHADEAVLAFERRPRAIVLLDMKLNGKNGLEVLAELRQRNAQAIVFMMSGIPEMHPLMQQAEDLSGYETFTKPLELDSLFDTIDRAARTRGQKPAEE